MLISLLNLFDKIENLTYIFQIDGQIIVELLEVGFIITEQVNSQMQVRIRFVISKNEDFGLLSGVHS